VLAACAGLAQAGASTPGEQPVLPRRVPGGPQFGGQQTSWLRLIPVKAHERRPRGPA
jgi:hypothetical protein